MTLHNLAALYDTQKKYQEAEKKYAEALIIYRQLSKDNPNAYMHDLATCLNGIAINHKSTKKFDKAEVEFQEALKIIQDLAKGKS